MARANRKGGFTMNILISFLNLLLYIAIILLVAYVILWVVRDWFNIAIDSNVMKFAKIVVGLICLIAIVVWLAGVLGGGVGLPHFFPVR
jgi:flagellar biosynthesis protein FlhB